MEATNYKPIGLTSEVRIDKLYSLHYFTYSKRFRFEGESHDFWELIYCDSGEARIVDNDQEFHLRGGEAFIHAPNHFHTVHPNNKQTNVVIVSFNGKLDITSTVFTLTAEEKTLIKMIISEGREAFSEPLNIVHQYELKLSENLPIGTMQVIKNCLELLIIKLNRKTMQTPKAETQSRNHSIAAQVIEVLQHSLHQNITLEQLSAQLSYSTAYLKQAFKNAEGCGIIQYFNQLKIQRAKQMLVETNLSIAQISDALAFHTPQYFTRLFKQITNMTPTAYQSSVTQGVL